MKTEKNNFQFLKGIEIEELKAFLSSHNEDKTKTRKEFFTIESNENEFRLDLYNVDIATNKKTKINYMDFLSDYKFCIECVGRKSKKYDTKYLEREMIKIFIKKYGTNYIEKYLEDFKSQIEQKDEKCFFALLEIRSLVDSSLARSDKNYFEAKILSEETCRRINIILRSVYKETKKELYLILKEFNGKK